MLISIKLKKILLDFVLQPTGDMNCNWPYHKYQNNCIGYNIMIEVRTLISRLCLRLFPSEALAGQQECVGLGSMMSMVSTVNNGPWTIGMSRGIKTMNISPIMILSNYYDRGETGPFDWHIHSSINQVFLHIHSSINQSRIVSQKKKTSLGIVLEREPKKNQCVV